MSAVEVRDESAALARAIRVLAGVPGGVKKASYAALRRAGDTAKTRAGEFAATEYTLNKGDFMRHVAVSSRVSEGANQVALELNYGGFVLPLLTFDTKYTRGGRLTTRVKRASGAKMLEHAFAARVYGPVAVFERVGAPRLPVSQKFGPSTAHMLANEVVTAKMDETIRDTFERRMEHEISRLLSGVAG